MYLNISIHSLIRGRTIKSSVSSSESTFQSTPSYEGEHTTVLRVKKGQLISIHSLIRGRTRNVNKCWNGNIISIHSLIRGRTSTTEQMVKDIQFQSTPSYEGERLQQLRRGQYYRHFNPLPHTRENRHTQTLLTGWGTFQSTPSYEGEPAQIRTLVCKNLISIHSLIRGRTFSTNDCQTYHNISIHSLIRGRTKTTTVTRRLSSNFNPLPHTRENSASVTGKSAGGHFNPLPHTRENRYTLCTLQEFRYFNPLPHTRENACNVLQL